jgi:flagellar operon protein
MNSSGIRIGSIAGTPANAPGAKTEKRQTSDSFKKIFQRAVETEGIKFSKHARDRIVARGIELDNKDVARIAEAVRQLDEKGGKTSLLFLRNTTFLTNVKEKTIITALDNANEGRKVFTQIDSAVLVDE